jgi:4-hydroxy-tetrahydrodipicolinate synthase
MAIFQGAYTALITPFTEDGSAVDIDRLESNIADQAGAGISGVVPCGTTGETPTLTDAEYRLVVERSIAAAHAAGMSAIPGAGSNSTAHAVELHRFVHESGADAALHVSPYYNKPSQEGLYRHFMTIADVCALPVVVYNIPGRTGVLIEIDTIVRLAQHPNIQVVKEATGSVPMVAQITERTDLTVLSGDDPLTLSMATAGARGVISVLSNLLPDRVVALCAAILDGRWQEAVAVNNDLLPIARALLSLDTNPIPIKTAMHLAGRDSGVLRLPLCEPKAACVDILRTMLGAMTPAPVG